MDAIPPIKLDYEPLPVRVPMGARLAFFFGVSSLVIWPLVFALPTFLLLAAFCTLMGLGLGLHWGHKIRAEPTRYAGLGFTIGGTWTAVLGALLGMLAIAILPSLGRPSSGTRSVCSANLSGIIKSMVIYSVDNGNHLPVAGVPTTPWTYSTALGVSSGATTPAAALRAAHTRAAGNPLASLWMLVVNGQVPAKGLLCPNDPFNRGPAPLVNAAGEYLLTPSAPGQISYSIAYPWTTDAGGAMVSAPWWNSTVDSSLPLVCDMAPLAGTGRPARDPASLTIPTPGRVWNTFAHGGDGMEVGFGDAHVEWSTRPNVGQTPAGSTSPADADNIWTVGRGAFGGTAPAPGRMPAILPTRAPFDTVMVPLRNGDTGAIE